MSILIGSHEKNMSELAEVIKVIKLLCRVGTRKHTLSNKTTHCLVRPQGLSSAILLQMSEAKIDVYKNQCNQTSSFPLAQQPPGEEKCVWAQAQDDEGPVKGPSQERSPHTIRE